MRVSRSAASKKRSLESVREALRHRVVIAIRQAEITQAEIARALAVSPGRVSRWANPDDRQGELPSETYLPLLPTLLEVDGHWLLTGVGVMRRRDPSASRVALDRIERALRDMRNGKG